MSGLYVKYKARQLLCVLNFGVKLYVAEEMMCDIQKDNSFDDCPRITFTILYQFLLRYGLMYSMQIYLQVKGYTLSLLV